MPFFLAVLLLSLCGCATGRQAENLSTIRFFAGVNPDSSDRHRFVPLYQASELRIPVAKEPFLDEGHVRRASVEETVGGFRVRLEFDRRGSGLLRNASHQFRDRHIAIQAAFPETLWLGAPKMERAIDDGVFLFTPHLTREEARRLVDGLNALAEKLHGDEEAP